MFLCFWTFKFFLEINYIFMFWNFGFSFRN